MKIPYEIEKNNVLENLHKKTGHNSYYRLYREISTNKKYYWKGIIEDCKDYINKCTDCIKSRGGKKLTICPK